MNAHDYYKTSRIILIFLFSFMFFAAGCGDSEEQTGLQDVKEKASETAQGVKDYAGDQKNKFMNEAEKELEDINDQVDKIEKKMESNWDEMDQAARQRAKETLAALKEKQKALSEKLSELKENSAEAWKDAKTGFQDSYEALKKSLNDAREQLQEN